MLMADGIEAILSACSDMEIVAKSKAGIEAIDDGRRWRPHILILDIPAPDSASLALLDRLREELTDVRVITVSYQWDEASMQRVLQKGVRGYLCGREGAAELVKAVRAVAAGGTFLCPGASGVVVRHYRRKATQRPVGVGNDKS